jgi:hypothetical protein
MYPQISLQLTILLTVGITGVNLHTWLVQLFNMKIFKCIKKLERSTMNTGIPPPRFHDWLYLIVFA